MIAPAHAGHLGLLSNWIRSGAADGSFDAELADQTPREHALLRQSPAGTSHRLFRAGGPARPGFHALGVRRISTGPTETATARSRSASASSRPCRDLGYELWLTGLDRSVRRPGTRPHDAFFHPRERPRGRWRTSCASIGPGRAARRWNTCSRLSISEGVRDTSELRWFVRTDAPAGVSLRVAMRRCKTAPFTDIPLAVEQRHGRRTPFGRSRNRL